MTNGFFMTRQLCLIPGGIKNTFPCLARIFWSSVKYSIIPCSISDSSRVVCECSPVPRKVILLTAWKIMMLKEILSIK